VSDIGKKTGHGTGENPWRKLVVEMGPLLVFFLVNGRFGIFAATGAFMAAMAAAIAFTWFTTRKVPPMLWVSGILVGLFGGLTIWFQNDLFIKLKPTILNTLFAAILLIGLAFNRPFLKMLMAPAMPPIRDEGWRRMTINWALFFLLLAILNEIVWRNFSTDAWVNFKVFGILPLTVLFSLTQIPVIMRYQVDSDSKGP